MTWYVKLFLIVGLVFLATGVSSGSVWFFGGGLFLLLVLAAFLRPMWLLVFLLFYFPLEQFLLKFPSDAFFFVLKYASEIAIYLLSGSVLWKKIKGETWKKTLVDLPFLLFVGLLAVSAIVTVVQFSVPLAIPLLGIRQIVRFMLLFFVTTQLAPTLLQTRRFILGFLGLLFFESVIGLVQVGVGDPLVSFMKPDAARYFGDIWVGEGVLQQWNPHLRVFGTMARYDRLGTFLGLFLLLPLALMYERRILKHQHLFFLGLSIGFLTLIFTYSRSGWMGFIAGFLAIALYLRRDWRALTGFLVLLLAAGLSLLSSGIFDRNVVNRPDQNLAERVAEIFSEQRYQGEIKAYGRTYWLIETVKTVVPSAPLLGVGPGMFGGGAAAALRVKTVYDRLHLPFGVYGTEGYIDSSWMSLWGEIGSLGLLTYLFLFFLSLHMAATVYRNHPDPWARAVAAWCFGGAFSVSLNAMLSTALEYRTLAAYLWVIFGLVAVRYSEVASIRWPTLSLRAEKTSPRKQKGRMRY